MRIVVADQDDSFLEPFQLVLRARGHEVATVSDGLSCLNALRDFEPDVLAMSSNLLWGGSEGVLSILGKDEAEPCEATRNQFVANAIPCTENAFWNA